MPGPADLTESKTRSSSATSPAGTTPFIPDDSRQAERFRTDPIAFLQECLARQATIGGYTCRFQKRERSKKAVQEQTMRVEFREKPFSVRMHLVTGNSGARDVLYVEGENDGNMVILPRGILSLGGLALRKPDSSQVMDGHRYSITRFGMTDSLGRNLQTWIDAKFRDKLETRWLGLQATPELEGKQCLVLTREHYDQPEEDGVEGMTLWLDPETGQQLGSRVVDGKGVLIAEYWYLEVKNNPVINPARFQKVSMK